MSLNRSTAMVSHILNTPMPLPSIALLAITTSAVGATHTSMRHFISKRLPILKYHNPHLKVTIAKTRAADVQSTIQVTKHDSSVHTLQTHALGTDADIFRSIVDLGRA